MGKIKNSILKYSEVLFAFFSVFWLFYWKSQSPWLSVFWNERLCILQFFCVAIISFFVSKKIHWTLGFLTAVVLSSSVTTIGWFDLLRNEPFEVQSAIKQASGEGLLCYSLIGLFVFLISKRMLDVILGTYLFFALYISTIIIWRNIIGINTTDDILPFLNNPSMTGTMIAMGIPLSFKWKNKKLSMFALFYAAVAILYTKATVPAFGLIAGIMAMLLCCRPCLFLIFTTIFSLFFYGLKDTEVGTHILDASGRYEMWGWIIDFIKQGSLFRKVTGYGHGVYRVIGPIIQANHGVNIERGPWFLFLHNEYLQVAFDTGVLGLLAFVMVCITALIKTFKRPYLFSCVATCLCVFTANFPLRWGAPMFFCSILTRAAFRRRLIK